MIQVDLPVAFGSGTLLASALEHNTHPRTWPYLYQRGLAKNLIFQVLFALWLPVYLLVSYFGFQTSHMFWHEDALTNYPALLPVFLILYFVTNIAGFHAGAWLVLRGRARLARLIFVAAFTYFALWITFQPNRTLTLGTFKEWNAGTAPWIWTSTWFMSVLAVGALVFFVGITAMYRSLKAEAIALVGSGGQDAGVSPIRASSVSNRG
jgi:uncharacterized membrane protein YfcA